MGEAILLAACLTGLQGLRGPLGWEPAEAAGTNNVLTSLTGSRGAGSHGAREDDSLKTFLSCIIINYTTIAYSTSYLTDLSHTHCQLDVQLLICAEAGLQAVNQSAVTR